MAWLKFTFMVIRSRLLIHITKVEKSSDVKPCCMDLVKQGYFKTFGSNIQKRIWISLVEEFLKITDFSTYALQRDWVYSLAAPTL